MLSLSQIEEQYPEYLRPFKRHMMREYMHYKILEIIFNSTLYHKLSFLGGTSLRIIYQNTRFSEDLDFDNFNLTEEEFSILAGEIENKLKRQGYEVEIRNVFKHAYHCYIKFPGILFDNRISGYKNERIVIQIDTEPHDFDYTPQRQILNKFDVFTQVFVTPLDILLSQKFYLALNRKRPKGRDYFDIIFLLGKTKPNFPYLKDKINVDNGRDLKRIFVKHLDILNLNSVIEDVRPFLFDPQSAERIKMLKDYINQIDLG